MEFVLYYRGPLRVNGNPAEKQAIRRFLHAQLRELWSQKPLNEWAAVLTKIPFKANEPSSVRPLAAFQFVPLATEQLHVIVDLHITFLRPEEPGALITQGGDIDNRLKTLFDALRMPKLVTELPSGDVPLQDEAPFYCLLEDDNLITGIHVQTERWLGPSTIKNEVMLLIRVRTKVTQQTIGNLFLI